MAQRVKNLPAIQETLGQEDPLGHEDPLEGNGNPLQYSCLENPMDKGAWQATVHGAAESDTTEHSHTRCLIFSFFTHQTSKNAVNYR